MPNQNNDMSRSQSGKQNPPQSKSGIQAKGSQQGGQGSESGKSSGSSQDKNQSGKH